MGPIHSKEQHGGKIMKRIFLTALILFASVPLWAKLKVVTTYPYIKGLVTEIASSRASVQVLSSGKRDPHFITPRPSLIAKVRRADLVVINGAELEIGWLPPIIRDARNRKVRPGQKGFLDLSRQVKILDKPESVSRSQGDIHPSGNPHFSLDPANMLPLAKSIARRLSALDPSGRSHYNRNLAAFTSRWRQNLLRWKKRMGAMKGKKVIQYHKQFDYFYRRYGINAVMEIEPLPGIPPTSGHIVRVIRRVKQGDIALIITDVYHSKKPAKLVAAKTGVKCIIMPHDIGSFRSIDSLENLFDDITGRFPQ